MARLLEEYKRLRKGFGVYDTWRQVVIPRLLPKVKISSHSKLYEAAVYDFFDRNLSEVLERYKDEQPCRVHREIELTIWTMWWQGEEQMPAVIRECYESILRNANGRKVILMTRDNYKDYIQFPDYIQQKIDNGLITLTHLSDFVRVEVLARYGGLYMDCALFVTKPIVLDQNPFFSTRVEGNPTGVANRHKWVFGLIGGYKGTLVARLMRDMFYTYWQKYDVQITYLMMDFMLLWAYNHLPAVQEEIDMVTYHSPNLHESRYLFNKQIDEERFENYIKNNTFFSLTYRFEYPLQIDGVDTYYGRMIKTCKK